MAVQITATIVKKLRDKTGAGMMTCKQALTETNGNFEKAIEILKLRGDAVAEKKTERIVNEGLIESYIHTGNKLGILIEVNCETDFVSRKSEFKEFVKNIAMQIASSPNIEIISMDDVSDEMKQKIWEFESLKEDIANKPENIKEQIINGRVLKNLKQRILFEQEYIRDNNLTVKDYVNQQISYFGENIKIARYTKYILGS